MKETVNLKVRDDIWAPEEMKSITNRIEMSKEGSGCFISDTMEILEVVEQLEGMRSVFPASQQHYFLETADELIGLAISRLEQLRAELPR